MEKIKYRLKSIMKSKDMSMGELSGLTGIPKTTISRYLNDVASIPTDRLSLIAIALNTTPTYIMGWEKNIDSEEEHMNELCKEIKSNSKLRDLIIRCRDLNDDDLKTVLIHVNGIRQSKNIEEKEVKKWKQLMNL